VPTTSPHDADDRPVLSRRAVLSLAGAAVASGVSACTPKGVDRRAKPQPSPSPTPEEDPDVTLAATVLAGEQAILDRLTATVRRHPGLRGRLLQAEAAHRAHVRLLTDAVPDKVTPSTTVSASPTPTPTASGSPAPKAPPPVPGHPGPALAVLAREEGRLSLLDKRSSFSAESGAFARVLASMAASAAQHAVVLTAAAARENR
jgi:hypothetical protein